MTALDDGLPDGVTRVEAATVAIKAALVGIAHDYLDAAADCLQQALDLLDVERVARARSAGKTPESDRAG